jgi:hypothetical protein
MILLFPPATELPCSASALATNASGLFGEMKSGRDDGYVSLISTGHRSSLRDLRYSNNCFGAFPVTEVYEGLMISFPHSH